ncbi:DUF3574 domain-containing protein [Methylomonas sp. AM2-LC]|uniref:DUF3574 domain-containing protein n=1 Tax=Methylomonas sp. AM2-LC TaxID=3153301 RepID=UPI00326679B1
MRILAKTACLFLPVVLSSYGCSNLYRHGCNAQQTAELTDTLYFGSDKSQGRVTKEAWRDFVSDTITPRFPQGFTVLPAQGQWQNAQGQLVQEESYVLFLIHPDDTESKQRISEIVTAYKNQFQQEAVLRVQTPACVSF